MKNITYILAFLCAFTNNLIAQPFVQFELVAGGFSSPVDISNAGDSRLFIVEQNGRIKILDSAYNALPIPFLDISANVNCCGERGLLGLTFHPNYASNGYFYVNYTHNSGATRISRFSVNAGNPDLANPGSELILMTVAQPFANHNAGDLVFGPDGYLYFGLGDGGNGGDPLNNAQNKQALLGKIIRLDVDIPAPYVPASNPFVNDTTTLDEIFALGVRNPWRISFDQLTNDLWIADVGQSTWEEVDIIPFGTNGGQNFGWRCYEGDHAYNTGGCQAQSFYDAPIYEYDHGTGSSITGGFVYRGTAFPELDGHYILADYISGFVTTIFKDSVGNYQNTAQTVVLGNISTFGESNSSELYAARLSGNIYRVKEVCEELRATLSNWKCVLTANFSVPPPGGTTYQWLLNGTPIAAATGTTYTATEEGSYAIEVTGASSCVLVSDAMFISSVSEGISAADTAYWNAAYEWGNHANAGYLTAEIDPEVGANTTNKVPVWNGAALVAGSISDVAGNIVIGATPPAAGYLLSVDGRIICEELQILPSGSWPDYVFNKEYKLLSLNEVENYIQQNKHLPGVPSAECVEEDGIALGEMSAIMMEKIEELTLHMIEQSKQLNEQSEQIKNLQNENIELREILKQ